MPKEQEVSVDLQLPSTTPKQFVFVLMPFNDEFTDTYELGIKAACQAAGAYCERVDEQTFQGSMMDRVYHQISTADLIVADMSGRNPNVFYEVGYAHALGKRVILLTRSADDIPFDLKHYQHIVYEDRILDLRNDLERAVKYYLAEPDAQVAVPLQQMRFFIEGQQLTRGTSISTKLQVKGPPAEYSLLLDLIGRNVSSSEIQSSRPLSLRLAPPIDGNFIKSDDMLITTQGYGLWNLPALGNLFPHQEWGARVRVILQSRASLSNRQLDAFLIHYGPLESQLIPFQIKILPPHSPDVKFV